MKNKFVILLIFIAGIIILLSSTCPSRTMHQDKIEEVINAAVKNKMGKGTNILDAGIKYFSKALIKGALDIALDEMLTVNDYYIFSIGKIEYDGEEHIISVGIMNNIITFDEEDVVREIENHVW